MRRARRKAGRLAVSTWRSDDESSFLRDLRHVADRHLGTIADQRYGFGDASALEALLRDAGLQEVSSRVLSRTIRFEDGAAFLQLNTMAFVGMSASGKEMTEDERKRTVEAIVRESAPVLASYSEGSGLNLAIAKG
jgi:hypothetical protein